MFLDPIIFYLSPKQCIHPLLLRSQILQLIAGPPVKKLAFPEQNELVAHWPLPLPKVARLQPLNLKMLPEYGTEQCGGTLLFVRL